MKTLLRADLTELFKNRLWLVYALLTAFYILLFPLGGNWTYFYFNIDLGSFDFLARMLLQIPVFLLSAVYAALHFCGLFRGGACQKRIAAGYSKVQIFASRFLSLAVSHGSLFFCYYAVSAVFAAAVRGNEALRQTVSAPTAEGLYNELLYGLGSVALLWSVCAFFSFLFRKRLPALAAVIGVAFLLPAVVSFPYYLNVPEFYDETLPPEQFSEIAASHDEDDYTVEDDGEIRLREAFYLDGAERVAAEALCCFFPSYKIMLLTEEADGREIPIPREYLAYPLIWYADAAAVCAAAYLIFRKRDLN
ncbi:MAG: hypothetical protein IJL26_00175 [Clostridia bacterium]|nr:hypothetical protein [Clostridia bacterium]